MMSVDKFGHHSRGRTSRNMLKVTFPHTVDGNINAGNVKISNIKDPSAYGDAATKKYVDEQLNSFRNITSPLIQAHGLLLQKYNDNIQDIAIGLNDVRDELHKTNIPIIEAHIASLQNKSNEIDASISSMQKDIATHSKYIADIKSSLTGIVNNVHGLNSGGSS